MNKNQNLKLVQSEDAKNYYELTITKRKHNYVIKFDEDDLKLIEPYTWNISKDGYAVTNFVNRNNKTIYLNMHKIIYEHHNGKVAENYDIDHINNDKLDNRKQNLQVLTKSQNIKKARASKISGHLYIYFDNQRNKYRCNYKNKYIGRFDTLEEALEAQKNYINKNNYLYIDTLKENETNKNIKTNVEPQNEQKQTQ